MSAWITDRLPTREDAGHTTMVWVSSPREVYPCDYSVVSLGQPWQPITYPEPYQKPKKWELKAWCDFNGASSYSFVNNGVERFRISTNTITFDEALTMTDALNRLEEGV